MKSQNLYVFIIVVLVYKFEDLFLVNSNIFIYSLLYCTECLVCWCYVNRIIAIFDSFKSDGVISLNSIINYNPVSVWCLRLYIKIWTWSTILYSIFYISIYATLILCIYWNQKWTVVAVIILVKWHRSSCQEWRNLLVFLQKLILLGTFNHKLALFIRVKCFFFSNYWNKQKTLIAFSCTDLCLSQDWNLILEIERIGRSNNFICLWRESWCFFTPKTICLNNFAIKFVISILVFQDDSCIYLIV